MPLNQCQNETTHFQVRTRKIIAIIMMMAYPTVETDMLDLMKNPVAALQDLLSTLGQSSALQKLAPAVASLFAKEDDFDFGALSSLFAHEWLTEEIFGACLSRAVHVDTRKCLGLLGQAIHHFPNSTNLVACLWNLQVTLLKTVFCMAKSTEMNLVVANGMRQQVAERPVLTVLWVGACLQVHGVEDADSLVSFLNLPHVTTVLEQYTDLQESIFAKLHSWTLDRTNCEQSAVETSEKYLKACLLCVQPHQLPILHHTWALLALSGGNLPLALEHLELLLKSTEVTTNGPVQTETGTSQNMAGHLLRLKVLSMVCTVDRSLWC